MRLLHLSDLHFGTAHNDLTQATRAEIITHRPELLIISGDFTQTASRGEFEESRRFLDSLPCPYFCVPGNHDIPRFHLWERFFNPFKRYKTYIHPEPNPVFEHDHVLVVGINSARPVLPHWNWANGAVSQDQLDFIARTFKQAEGKFKILTLHHPIHAAEGVPLNVTVFGGHKCLNLVHQLRIDLVLTGHVHHASVTTIEHAVFLSAATALSSRIRYQENGYNIIDFDDEFFEITHRTYRAGVFVTENQTRHRKI